jgi:uncharacterized protein (TIGR03382 family)
LRADLFAVRFLTLLVALAIAAPALAWESMSVCADDRATRWADPQITWHLSSTHLSDDLSQQAVRTAVDAAFVEWTQPYCSALDPIEGEPLAVDPFGEDGSDVVIGFYEGQWPEALGVGLLALTRITWNADNCTITDGDIVFNGTECTWVNGLPAIGGEKDFQSVVTHEVGHLLGFDHSTVGGSTMSYPYEDDISWRTLGCDDTAAVCATYTRGDVACIDSAYCPCGHPCVDGVCQGLTFEEGEDECWTWFEPDEDYTESEPNDNSVDSSWIKSEGGDLVIQGSLTSCGNDGELPTGDMDWLNIDAPCEGDAWITVDPSALDADVDVFAFVDGELVGYDQYHDAGEQAALEASLSRDFQLLVYCWEGAATNWTLRVHYLSPGEEPSVPENPPDCGCSTVEPAGGSSALALLLLVAVGRRRRR